MKYYRLYYHQNLYIISRSHANGWRVVYSPEGPQGTRTRPGVDIEMWDKISHKLGRKYQILLA